MDQQHLEHKLVYLHELQHLSHSPHMAADESLSDRINLVCDSIEKDLGIAKPFSPGDIQVKLEVNAEKTREIIEDIIQRTANRMGITDNGNQS